MTEVTAKLESIISGHKINEDDAAWLRGVLAAYEQAQAEPVAWLVDRGDKGKLWYTKLPSAADIAAHGLGPFVPLFAAPVAQAATPAPAAMNEMLKGLGFDGQCPESIGITLERWRDGYAKWIGAATPAPATLADRLRAKEAQEIASKFDTRAALEKARKDRAATPAPAPLTLDEIIKLAAIEFPSKQWQSVEHLVRAVERAHGIGKEASNG